MAMTSKHKLDAEVLQNLLVGREDGTIGSNVSDAVFSFDGRTLALASKVDKTLYLYDTFTGQQISSLPQEKYGIEFICFTHDRRKVVISSSKGNHDLRLVDITKNSFKAYLHYHKVRVTKLAMSGSSHHMLSSDEDGVVCIWTLTDLAKPLHVIEGGKHARAALDPIGTYFAVLTTADSDGNGHDMPTIKLYDLTDPSVGPFKVLSATGRALHRALMGQKWNSLYLCPNQTHAIASARSGLSWVMNTAEDTVPDYIIKAGDANTQCKITSNVIVDPTSRCLLFGDELGRVHFWITDKDLRVAKKIGPFSVGREAVQHVVWNPVFFLITIITKQGMAMILPASSLSGR
eukprot:Clim_evm44s207 gene=Clim_evmTU44s207